MAATRSKLLLLQIVQHLANRDQVGRIFCRNEDERGFTIGHRVMREDRGDVVARVDAKMIARRSLRIALTINVKIAIIVARWGVANSSSAAVEDA